jgi:hypothetical protein
MLDSAAFARLRDEGSPCARDTGAPSARSTLERAAPSPVRNEPSSCSRGTPVPRTRSASVRTKRRRLPARRGDPVPRISKQQKTQRDRAILKGLALLFGDAPTRWIAEQRFTRASLAKRFDDHIQAMARVHDLTLSLRRAVQEEREIEARLRPIIAAIKDTARGQVGKHDSRMRRLGFEPDRKPVMSIATKVLANAKRQATREKRGVVGKKRRKAGGRR